MGLIMHQFRKDIRHFKSLLIVWFVLIGLQSALSASSAGAISDDMRMQIALSIISFIVPLLQVILLIIIIPLLVQDEPLVGSTAFWFTRPISRKTLLITKASFVAFLLFLPPLLAEVIVLACNGITAYHIMLAVPEIFMEKLSFMLPLLLLAALTQNFARFALAGGIIFVIIMLLNWLLLIIKMYTGDIMEMMGDISLQQSRVVVSGIITIVCGTALLIQQYLARKTVRTIIACVVVFMTIMGTGYFWQWDFLKPRAVLLDKKVFKHQDLKLVVKTDNLSIYDDFKMARKAERYKTISGEVSVLGEQPGHFIEVRELNSIKLNFPDGVTIASDPCLNWQHGYSNRGSDALQHVLGETTIVNTETQMFSPYIQLMSVKENDYITHRAEKGVYSAEALCSLYEYEIAAALPLKRAARYDKGSEHAAIIDVLHETAGCTIVLRECSVNLLFDTKKEKRQPSEVFMEDKVKKVYILRNKKRGEAFLSERDIDMYFFANIMQQKRLASNTLRLHYTSINEYNFILPEIDEEWLANADLLRIEAVHIGDFSRSLRAENFSFKRTLGHPGSLEGPDKTALAKVTFPEDPTKEKLQSYVREILKVSEKQSSYSPDDPQVMMLEEIGPENIEILIDEDAERMADLYLIEAIKRLFRPEHKEIILRALPDHPELCTIVLREGWQSEVRDILTEELKVSSADLPVEWAKAVASFEDPSTYEDLRMYFLNTYAKEEIYNVINNLPGFDVEEAVAAAWQRSKYGNVHNACAMIPIAMEYGHVDALEMAVKVVNDKTDIDSQYHVQACHEALQKYTDAEGSGAEIESWFHTNRDMLVFDREKKRFIVKQE